MDCRTKTGIFLHIVCPILAGAMIYYLVSPEVIFVKKISTVIGENSFVPIGYANSMIVRLIRNYLPDMLWGYALVFALFYLSGNNTVSIQKIFFIAFSFSAVMEILQMIPAVRGTFDVFDIGVECWAEAFAVFIIKKFYLREEIRK